MDIEDINRIAWNEEVKRGNYWSRIVDEQEIRKAKEGKPCIMITPEKNVPFEWIKDSKGKKVLLLASGGGQQTPIMSAYGCDVTTVDQSEGQLEQDKIALDRYKLKANLVKADIRKTGLDPDFFDYVINPVSLNFIDDIISAYKEVHKVLKRNGFFIFGIANPILYTFDDKCQEKKLKMKYTLPFSDLKSLSKRTLDKRIKRKDTIEFSHTLDSIIGGLLHTGFVIEDFYSDKADSEPTDSFVYDSFLAFKARRI